MAVTETTTESWGSRLGGAFKGVIGGIALFIAGFPILFWNEGNAIKTRKALEEGAANCISVESAAQIDHAYNDKLVHMTAVADTDDILTDDLFGVSEKAIRLERKVEMYQWLEDSHTTEKKNMGGSVTKTTTYTYRQDWVEEVVSSADFKEAGHDNPGFKEFESAELAASLVKFGAFRLSQDQVRRIGSEQTIAFSNSFTCRVDRAVVRGQTIYVPNAETRNNAHNNRDVVAMPRVGDMRVTFNVVRPHEISLVARQHGDTFVPYVASNGKKVSLLGEGVKAADEMFASAQSANSTMCWLIRLGGWLLMFIGVSMVLKPLSVLGDVLPILGNILEIGVGIVAFGVSLPCALVTIAIAWLYYRPVVAIVLIALAAALVWWLYMKRHPRTPAVPA